MRRLIPIILSVIAALLVATPAYASNACATTGDTCQIVVKQSAKVPWIVQVFTLAGAQARQAQECTEIGPCTFTVPYKSEVLVAVHSTLPFGWNRTPGNLKGVSAPGKLTRAFGMVSGTDGTPLIVEANQEITLGSFSPVEVAQSAGRVAAFTRLSILGRSMRAEPLKSNPNSMSDTFGDCGIDSSVLPQGPASASNLGLVLALIDADGNVVAQADEQNSIFYGEALKPLAENDRRVVGVFDLPTRTFPGDVLRLVATIDNENGTCESRLGSIDASAFTVEALPPTITTDLLPAAYVDSGNYQYQLSAQNVTGEATWITIGTPLPEGLSVSRSGLLTAKDVQPGTYQVTVIVQDSSGAVSSPRTIAFTALPYTVNRMTETQWLTTRGCTAGAKDCWLGIESVNGNFTSASIDGKKCAPGELCARSTFSGGYLATSVSVPASRFVSAEMFFLEKDLKRKPVNGISMASFVRVVGDQVFVESNAENIFKSRIGDLLMRITQTPAIKVSQEPDAPSIVLRAKFSELKAAAPWEVNAATQAADPSCPTTALTAQLADGGAPTAVAVFSDESTLSQPFAVVPFKLVANDSGGNEPFDAIAAFASPRNHPSGTIYMGVQLHAENGELLCAPTSKTIQAISYVAPKSSVVVTAPAEIRMIVGHGIKSLVTASGGTDPYVYSLAAGSLPKGLTLASSGALYGRPAEAGYFEFTVRAVDASGNTGVSDPVQMFIDWSVVTTDLPQVATAGSPIDPVTVQAIGWESRVDAKDASISYSAIGVPAGVTFDPTTRRVSGTPRTAGDYLVVFTASVSVGKDVVAKHLVTWPLTVLPAEAPKLEVFTVDNVQPPTTTELAKLPPEKRKRAVPAPPTTVEEQEKAVKPNPALAINADGAVVQVPPPLTVFASAASDAGTASASAALIGKNTPVPTASVAPVTSTKPGSGTSSGTAPGPASVLKTLTLTFAANKATAAAPARAAFAAAIKAFGAVTSVAITSPTVVAKNGKPTKSSQAIAYLRTQVVKNQLKAAGAGSAAVTTKATAQKKASATVTVTLKR